MKKSIVFAFIAVIFVACNSREQQKEVIPMLQLDEKQSNLLSDIFSESNDLLYKYLDFNVVVIRSNNELYAICPSSSEIPDIDFAEQCLVFAPVELSSINDEILGTSLVYDNRNGLYEFQVEIQKCTNCYWVTHHTYAYGVFMVSSDELKQIKAEVQLFYSK